MGFRRFILGERYIENEIVAFEQEHRFCLTQTVTLDEWRKESPLINRIAGSEKLFDYFATIFVICIDHGTHTQMGVRFVGKTAKILDNVPLNTLD